MISVDIKSLLRRLNRLCTRALESAAGLCVSRNHYEVTIEHLILKLTEEPGADIQMILSHYDTDPFRVQKVLQRTLEDFRSGNAGKPVFSPQLLEWFRDSWLIASIDLGLTEVRSGVLLASLVGNPDRYSFGKYLDVLENVHADELKRKFFDLTAGSSEEQKPRESKESTAGQVSRGEETALGRFTIDFTARARANDIDPVFGRDREIRQMIDILARRRKNNPICVGEAGVGKTAVVEGMALKVVQGDVPDVLKGVDILGLDLGLLQAGAGVRGEFENRLKSVIAEVKSSLKPVILFIDECHTLIGAGGAAGTSDAANLLKPALARGELRTIAATTWPEYKQHVEKDAALARRFQLVSLDEPSVETTIVILRGLRDKYEQAHNVRILDSAVVEAARLASRYISGRQLPDKAVDLLDTASARVKVGLTSRPDRLEDIERHIQTLERERAARTRDRANGTNIDEERVAEIDQKIGTLREELDRLDERWRQEKQATERLQTLRDAPQGDLTGAEADKRQKELIEARQTLENIQGKEPLLNLEVTTDVVAKVVSDWTGIPIGKMVKDEAQSILQLPERIKDRIKGQDEAIEAIARGIRASKAGLGNPRAPIGVFLLVGPSGVGKTETGLCLADLLFGGERFMVTINMSEFQEKHTVSRLIGAPPGYKGHGEGGRLTEAVRQRPYSVVLLDEVEKADPEVLNLFYQVFDKGMLADGESRVVDFKNTVILLTSNLASDLIMQAYSNGTNPSPDEVISAIRPTLSAHFKPALLARMTIVPFCPIKADAMKSIVELKVRQIGARLTESHRMHLDYDPAVVEHIAQRCTEVETGARNIDHIMQGTLLPNISTKILQRMSEGPLPTKLHLSLNEQGEFQMEFV